ncbi:MAG: peroxide stress protein YaaA [Clostridiales bacterium]|nr:peroxide stress protein YaaA [Clostridiales bacterium]
MIIVISPAKTLDFEKRYENLPITNPRFLNKSKEIMKELVKYDSSSLEKLMKVSAKLAKLTEERNEKWNTSLESAKQALLAFRGEVFRGMDSLSFTDAELFYANDHLRILSGLYGVLRPFDGINEYRLEMGTKLPVEGKKNLYEYWGKTLEESIAEELKNSSSKILINLASKEYYKSIEAIEKEKEIQVITPVFKELRGDEYKVITIRAKRARGLMTRYIIQNEIDNIEDIKKFNIEDYEYNEELSNDKELVFTR